MDIALCRTPEIMADGACCVLANATFESGNFYINEAVLAAHGVTDLDAYAVTPGNKNFFPDFFVD